MKTSTISGSLINRLVCITAGDVRLYGELDVPADASGLVLFAHGSGSSRHSPRNQFVAREIREAGIGTLLFDLLTRDEEQEDARTGYLRFDIEMLAGRLTEATRWVGLQTELDRLKIGYFGASTGGGAALMAAAGLGGRVSAVVSRGGRPDLAAGALRHVNCPTLLIVGGLDDVVIRLNQEAYAKLPCTKELRIIPGATHLFPEHGKLEEVAKLSAGWFSKYLGSPAAGR